MPKITRKQQKVFAVNASNNGVFGSLQANDPVYSQDPDAIQGRTAYSNGWNDATYSSEKLPPLEEFQALQYLFSRQIAYLMQEGVSEWNSATTYYKGALVKAVQQDGSFILYASLIDDNTGNQVTDTTKWVITNTSTNFHQGIPNWRADVVYSQGDWVKSSEGADWSIYESLQDNNLNNAVSNTSYWVRRQLGSVQPLLSFMWSDHQLDDIYWLRADTFSWQSGAIYETAYNHLVDDIDGKTATSETIGSYTISYYLADDGHKITTDEATVLNIYNESGVAWYYVLDTVNTRFKLPRTKYGFVGLRDTVGKYVPESLPNITAGIIWNGCGGATTTTSGAWRYNASAITSQGGAGMAYGGVDFDASRSSSTYQDNAPVQQRATQMYLYFYMGQTIKNQNLIDAGAISEELNNKMDNDRIQFVSVLPANPVPNTLYLIEE